MTMADKALIVLLINIFHEDNNLETLRKLEVDIDEGWKLFINPIIVNKSAHQISLKCPTL
jgi:hypothetical protein